MNKTEKPWWFPVLCDAAYCERLREDYPEHADLDDESLIDHFNDGLKYSNTWDHTGDAYAQFEPMADAFLEMLAALEAVVDACTSAPPVEIVRRIDAAASLCAAAISKAQVQS